MKKVYIYILAILENKKLHMLTWLLILIYVLWGLLHPEKFTYHKWGTMSTGGQYTIVLTMLAIVVFQLSRTYLAIKKEGKRK